MHEVKKINVWSFARIEMIIFALVGLFVGIFMALVGMSPTGEAMDIANFQLIYGASAIILAPIFYGLAGLASGALSAWIYNLLAKWVGGFKVELAEIKGK